MRRQGPLLAALLLLPGPVLAFDGTAETLLEVPQPALDRFEPAVRTELEAAQRAVEEAGDDDRPALARAYGEWGRRLLAYNLTESADAAFANASRLAPESFAWPYYRGAIAENERRLDDARKHLEQALSLRPVDLPSLLRAGRVALLAGDLEQAERHLSEVLELQPQSAAALFELGKLAARRGELDLAIARFEEALALQPQATTIVQPLAFAYRDRGDRERARALLRSAGQGAVQFLDPLVQELQASGAAAIMLRGTVAARRGDHARAKELFLEALAIAPDDRTTLKELAVAQERLGELPEALRTYRRIAELAPEEPAPRADLGAALVRQQATSAEGLALLEQATAEQPALTDAQVYLARALLARGDPEAALKRLESALASSPDDGAALLWRARAEAAGGRPETAMATLAALLEREPQHFEAALDLATLRVRHGRTDDALAALDGTLAANPGAAAEGLLRFSRGNLLEQAGRLEEAYADLERAVLLVPDFRDAHYNLGLLASRLQHFSDAADAFSRAAELAEDDLESRILAASAALQAGRDADAGRLLERALERWSSERRLLRLRITQLASAPSVGQPELERCLELLRRLPRPQRDAEDVEVAAMVLAALGRFEDAVAFQEQLVVGARNAGVTPERLTRWRQNLARYRAGKRALAQWQTAPSPAGDDPTPR